MAWKPGWWVAGERIPPVHKPAKQKQCEWVVGVGWVFNPAGKRFS